MARETRQLHTIVDQDGAAIFDTERGLISTLNSTGAYVWQALNRSETLGAIVTKISHDTGQTAFTVEQDVREFIQSLKENHLLPH